MIGVLLGLAVVLLFLLFAWLFGAFDNPDDPTSVSSTPSSSPSDPSQPEETPSSSAPDPEVRVEQMQAFVTDYAALAVDDPRTSWQMLTPDFQRASGGFGNY